MARFTILLCFLALTTAEYTPGQQHGREHNGEGFEGESSGFDVRTNIDSGTEQMESEIEALSPNAAVNLVNEHHEEIEAEIQQV
jgi:hypothetical protein